MFANVWGCDIMEEQRGTLRSWELSPQTSGGWPPSVTTAARYVIHETSPNRRRKGGTYFID